MGAKTKLRERVERLSQELLVVREAQQREREHAQQVFDQAIHSVARSGQVVQVIMPNGTVVKALVQKIDVEVQEVTTLGVGSAFREAVPGLRSTIMTLLPMP